jgi:hypothetical protein
MGRVLFAVAESRPFDALLVRDMKRTVNSLLQLNLKRFRVPDKTMAKYSALDVMKQALELLYEFTPSEKNYREAMRTIQVYSEGDEEMARTLTTSFKLIANAVYNAYTDQRRIESLAPELLFCEGITFEITELQQAFRFVGVRPPENPACVKRTVFLDEGFTPYKLLLEDKIPPEEAQIGREAFWVRRIEDALSTCHGTGLLRAGAAHFENRKPILSRLRLRSSTNEVGRLPTLLLREGIEMRVVERIADINQTFGKS